MPNYRRAWHPGGTYFFTVNLLQRANNDLLVRHIDLLRNAVRHVRLSHPFVIHAWVVLPEHLHCIIELPANDYNFDVRWRLIKIIFSKSLSKTEWRSDSRIQRGERGIWQRRYWEHLIRDERDFMAHMDYVHINPLKHGFVNKVLDWPYSTFHLLVKQGVYPADWAGGYEEQITYKE
jgi:putative transposase